MSDIAKALTNPLGVNMQVLTNPGQLIGDFNRFNTIWQNGTQDKPEDAKFLQEFIKNNNLDQKAVAGMILSARQQLKQSQESAKASYNKGEQVNWQPDPKNATVNMPGRPDYTNIINSVLNGKPIGMIDNVTTKDLMARGVGDPKLLMVQQQLAKLNPADPGYNNMKIGAMEALAISQAMQSGQFNGENMQQSTLPMSYVTDYKNNAAIKKMVDALNAVKQDDKSKAETGKFLGSIQNPGGGVYKMQKYEDLAPQVKQYLYDVTLRSMSTNKTADTFSPEEQMVMHTIGEPYLQAALKDIQSGKAGNYSTQYNANKNAYTIGGALLDPDAGTGGQKYINPFGIDSDVNANSQAAKKRGISIPVVSFNMPDGKVIQIPMSLSAQEQIEEAKKLGGKPVLDKNGQPIMSLSNTTNTRGIQRSLASGAMQQAAVKTGQTADQMIKQTGTGGQIDTGKNQSNIMGNIMGFTELPTQANPMPQPQTQIQPTGTQNYQGGGSGTQQKAEGVIMPTVEKKTIKDLPKFEGVNAKKLTRPEYNIFAAIADLGSGGLKASKGIDFGPTGYERNLAEYNQQLEQQQARDFDTQKMNYQAQLAQTQDENAAANRMNELRAQQEFAAQQGAAGRDIDWARIGIEKENAAMRNYANMLSSNPGVAGKTGNYE